MIICIFIVSLNRVHHSGSEDEEAQDEEVQEQQEQQEEAQEEEEQQQQEAEAQEEEQQQQEEAEAQEEAAEERTSSVVVILVFDDGLDSVGVVFAIRDERSCSLFVGDINEDSLRWVHLHRGESSNSQESGGEETPLSSVVGSADDDMDSSEDEEEDSDSETEDDEHLDAEGNLIMTAIITHIDGRSIKRRVSLGGFDTFVQFLEHLSDDINPSEVGGNIDVSFSCWDPERKKEVGLDFLELHRVLAVGEIYVFPSCLVQHDNVIQFVQCSSGQANPKFVVDSEERKSSFFSNSRKFAQFLGRRFNASLDQVRWSNVSRDDYENGITQLWPFGRYERFRFKVWKGAVKTVWI